MAGTDLIRIAKGDNIATCERRQLPAMQKAGWELAPEPVGEDRQAPDARAVLPAPGLLPMHKDGEIAWVDNATRAAMADAGWDAGEPDESDVDALADILGALDTSDDDLWNADGSLKMGAFNEAFGRKETRATIEAVWPGFDRDMLAAVDDEGDG